MKQLLQNKLEKYKKLLNLQNWQIQLIEEECLEYDGMTKIVYNDYRATIKINAGLSDTEKQIALVHELLHLVHRDELDVVRDNLDNQQINELYTRFHERSIEQMAKIIYKLIIVGGI